MARVRCLMAVAVVAVVTSAVTGAPGHPVTAHAAPTPGSNGGQATSATGLRPGVMPLVSGGSGPLRAPVFEGSLPPPNAHLAYLGGPVISAISVVQVLYGSGIATSLTWEAQVQRITSSPSVASFYGGITNSAYLDWMSEYSTRGSPQGTAGTNQTIGRGAFAGQVTITPSAGNDPFATSPAVVTDTQIQNELTAQITAGVIPSPQRDPSNRIRTLYAIYFPHGVTITIHNTDGTTDRSGVDFCAYHGTTSTAAPSQETYYSVLPDFSTGGMATKCGSGNEFQNVTAVSSHELAEAITDPEVGLAPAGAPGPPLAWYDINNGESGDICNGIDGTVTGGDGVTYTVQKIWSNAQGACVVATGPHLFAPHNVGAPQVAVTPDGSTQLVFWKDTTSNQLTEAWYTGQWNGPMAFPQLGALTSAPGVAVTKDGSTQLVFWDGPGGHLFEAWYTGTWNGPLDITSTFLGGQGILASSPSVVTTRDGYQLVFWRSADGHLGEAWYGGGSWHGPVDFTTLGSLASAPSATVTPDGSTQLVFFQGTDGRLTEDWFTGAWHGPMELGPVSSAPSVAVTPDGSTQLVFYRGPTGHLLESWYSGSWNGPVDWTSGSFAGDGPLTSPPSATVTVDGSTQLVFWQGTAASLWEGWYAGGSWHGPVNFSG